MVVRYPRKGHHSYNCSRTSSSYGDSLCQSLSGPVLDDLIAGRILAAVEPAALEASLAAVAEVERERSELARHWHLRHERAHFEADRAARQYEACEPENRLVARELERRWEEALKAARQIEDDFARWQRAAPGRLGPDDERSIRALATDLHVVWHAATTTPVERQRIAGLLIDHVSVIVDKSSERVDVEVHWTGGLIESHVMSRPVKRYDLQAHYPQLVRRLRDLGSEGLDAAKIAERLNAEGFRPPKRVERFHAGMVRRLLWHLDLAHCEPHGSHAGLGRNEYRPASLARQLDVSRDTVRRWLRAGWLTAHRDVEGHHVIWADASELRRLQELHGLPRTWETKGRLAELTKPKPHPER